MLFKFTKPVIYSLFLFAIVVTFAFPKVNTNESRYNLIKKETEIKTSYIYNDVLITTELNFKQLITQIERKLNNSNDPNKIIEEFPQIISIVPEKNIDKTGNALNKSAKILGVNGPYVNVSIYAKNKNLSYLLTLEIDQFNDLEKKQQLRLFTVTHLQNNRWETIPTRYSSPRKRLSLNLDERLPDLKPSQYEKGISHYIKNEVVIKFNSNVNNTFINNFIKKYNLTVRKRNGQVIIAHNKDKTTKELMKTLEKENKYIEYIEPHFIYLTNNFAAKKPIVPNDSLYIDYQWNLPIIFTEEGWGFTKGKENVVVAVVDTGVDLNHPEFKGKLVDGYNVVKTDKLPMDDDGHGTHVAGIISANTNNKEGIAGITWYNKIMPIKVLDQSGAGTLFDVAEGIIWAADHGAKVINLSLGNYAESKYLHEAIKYAYSKDVVIVSAAGNDNINELGYPASYPEVIAVGAIDTFQKRAEFSNYSENIDVVAPGVNIPSTYPDNLYAALSGTSMASPHVAALAGLIRSVNPRLTNKDVYEIIKKTATDLGDPGKDEYYGYGQINIGKAINNSTEKIEKTNIFLRWLKRIGF